MLGDERLLFIDDLINTDVGVEVGLNIFEDNDRTVSTSTSVAPRQYVDSKIVCKGEHGPVGADTNSVMESKTE